MQSYKGMCARKVIMIKKKARKEIKIEENQPLPTKIIKGFFTNALKLILNYP